MDEIIESTYYDITNTGSFGGARKLYIALRKHGHKHIHLKHVKEWLKKTRRVYIVQTCTSKF